MVWMVPSVTATVIGTCILALVYGYLFYQYRERHMGIWALSWAVYALKGLVELIMLSGGGSTGLFVVNQFFFIIIGLLFLWGAYSFMGRPVPRWPLSGAGICLIWSLVGLAGDFSRFVVVLPMLELIGFVYVWTGIAFLRFRGAEGAGRHITGWAFIIWGVHTADYPVLHPVEWFAPWGYLIGAVLKIVLALGILLVYFQKNVKDLDDNINYLNTLIDSMSEVFFTYDAGGKVTFINRKCADILGYAPEELAGRPVVEMIVEGQREEVWANLKERIDKGDQGRLVVSVYHREGGTRVVRMNVSSITGRDGQISGGMVLAEDITQRKRVEEELNLQKAYFQQLFENSPEAIVMLDNSDRIIEVNRAFERLFQFSIGEIRGRLLNEIFVPDNLQDEALFMRNTVLKGEIFYRESVRKRKDGSPVDVHILGYPILFGGRQVGTYGIYSDITDRKRAEERLRFLSLHDSLTGIYNRAYFEQEMIRLEAGCQFPVSIMVCDVDGLKLVNDTLGHNSGDELLILAARLIRESFRISDVVARIGGDEFAVLLPGSDGAVVESACGRIQESVENYNSANPNLPLSISVGFATSNGPSVNLNKLFKEADNNMYREKLHRSQSARSAIVQTLMRALEARDYITEGHGDRLKVLAEKLSRAIGLSERSVTDLRLLAQFHDVGKVGIPDRILFKKGPLTQKEFTEMKRHCEIGHRIAQSAPDLVPIADWILKHHEWWNGEGYPLGLRGEEIPLECRILAIVDAYDAMTSNRPYRMAMSHQEAVDEIRRCTGTQFDPKLVEIFIEVLEESGGRAVRPKRGTGTAGQVQVR